MVTDMEDWDTRSHLGLGDLAVSPKNPDVVVGVTEEGVVRSRDGGRSFGSSGPVLQFVSWAEDGVLVELTPYGIVHASVDGGSTWTSAATAAEAEAVEARSAARSPWPTALCSCHMMAVAVRLAPNDPRQGDNHHGSAHHHQRWSAACRAT